MIGKPLDSLHPAACQGHLQVVEVLLRRGTYPRVRTNQDVTPFKSADEPTKVDLPTQTLSTLLKPAIASDPQGVQGSKADARNDQNPQPEPDGVGKPISVQVVPDECFPAPGYVSSSRLRTWTPVTGYFAS